VNVVLLVLAVGLEAPALHAPMPGAPVVDAPEVAQGWAGGPWAFATASSGLSRGNHGVREVDWLAGLDLSGGWGIDAGGLLLVPALHFSGGIDGRTWWYSPIDVSLAAAEVLSLGGIRVSPWLAMTIPTASVRPGASLTSAGLGLQLQRRFGIVELGYRGSALIGIGGLAQAVMTNQVIAEAWFTPAISLAGGGWVDTFIVGSLKQAEIANAMAQLTWAPFRNWGASLAWTGYLLLQSPEQRLMQLSLQLWFRTDEGLAKNFLLVSRPFVRL
jgi:hypothetical protein